MMTNVGPYNNAYINKNRTRFFVTRLKCWSRFASHSSQLPLSGGLACCFYFYWLWFESRVVATPPNEQALHDTR